MTSGRGNGKPQTSIGKAKFAVDSTEGRLKVSFFGPFYAGYNIIALDTDYRYALVAGNNTSYLWQAEGLGYDTGKLVWTKQN
ncbi:MAG: lipocalin family protein [Puia sp.]|nr:lipocalin family protein [Puia sp.]